MPKHHLIFTRILLVSGISLLAVAAVATPQLAGRVLAADGTLDNPRTLAELQNVRLVLAAMGVALILVRGVLVRFFARHPDVLAVGLGTVVVSLLLGAGELALSLRCHEDEPATILQAEDGREPVVVSDAVLGYKPLPSSRILAKRKLGQRTLFEATYTQDAASRRVVPPLPAAAQGSGPEDVAVFFGCSFTYGEGVQDDETMPYRYALARGNTRALNFGYNGYGPQNMLAVLEDEPALRDLRLQIGEASTRSRLDTVYTFIDHHVKRANGAMSVMRYGKDLPAYEATPSGVVRVGSFASHRPFVTPLLRALSLSRILGLARVDWPLTVSDDDLKLTTSLIARSKARLAREFPDNRFRVLLYPGTRLADRLIPYLEGAGIEYLDYTRDAFGWNPETMAIPVDLHPSALGHAFVAGKLAEDLNRAEPAAH